MQLRLHDVVRFTYPVGWQALPVGKGVGIVSTPLERGCVMVREATATGWYYRAVRPDQVISVERNIAPMR